MRIQLSDLQRTADGHIETPILVLCKAHGEMIGAIGHAVHREMHFKFNEESMLSFQYPQYVNGVRTPLYDDLIGGRMVMVDPYGYFIIENPEESSDGSGIKTIKAYSLERELASKSVVLGEGVYNLWNPADPSNTLLGMIFDNIPNWSVGEVSASLIGRYRTFAKVEEKALSFLMQTVQKSYGCVFVFDGYRRVVNVIDADDTMPMLPIYLSKENLIKTVSVTEKDDEVVTRLYVQGADGVDILSVNPIGGNYIYNLDYYVGKGDIPDGIASKWQAWQNEIVTNQPYYRSLVALRNAGTAWLASAQAQLTELNNQLATQENLRATYLQAMMTYTAGSDQWTYFQQQLTASSEVCSALLSEISAQKAKIATIQSDITAHANSIADVVNHLSINNYFTADELDVLALFFHEDNFADPTFAVFDTNIEDGGSCSSSDSAAISFAGVDIIKMECDGGHTILVAKGGTISVVGTNVELTAGCNSALMDYHDGTVVLSANLGAGTYNDSSFPSGTLTCVGNATYDDSWLSAMTSVVTTISSPDGSVSYDEAHYEGAFSFSAEAASLYFTRNATDYQRYSVEQELYDYATDQLQDLAQPSFEFEISSGNFIYDEHFTAFKDAIQLGCGVYVQLDDNTLLTPLLLEISIKDDNPADFSLIFSNEFKRPDDVNRLRSLLNEVSTTSRSLNTAKMDIFQNTNTSTWVKDLIQNGYDAALAQIQAGKDNRVSIGGYGIVIDSTDGVDKVVLNNGMIALVDKRTNTVKMAMGHFVNATGATETDFVGVLADVIGGTLLAGQNLVIECPDINGGVLQFKVDSSGVVINNGRMHMTSDNGRMAWDPNYGFMAGTSTLFDATDTGHIKPSCIDDDGNLIFDDDGFPNGVNVWIGIDGQSYFRGNIYAESGYFKGTVQASQYLDANGKNMMADGKWNSSYLDLGNIIIDGTSGNITLTGAITWDGNNPAADCPTESETISLIGEYGGDPNPSYIKSTYISSTTIVSPTITGGTISGGAFLDLNQKSKLVLNPSSSSSSNADLCLYSGDNIAFEIYDEIAGSITLKSYYSEFLVTGTWGTTALGDWDFSSATVTGLTAAWG